MKFEVIYPFSTNDHNYNIGDIVTTEQLSIEHIDRAVKSGFLKAEVTPVVAGPPTRAVFVNYKAGY